MRIVIASIFILPLVACRDTSHGDDVVDNDSSTGEMTIQQVQSDSMAPGSPVELKGVIVTAVDAYGNKTGDFWVQEPEGGPYSGVHVYNAPLDQVATLAIGDVVDIKGAVKDEYTPNNASGSITELKPAMSGSMSVTKTSSGAAPAPQVVDALTIGQMPTWQARAAEWEKWEGVLITVTNVTAQGTPREVPSSNNPDPTRKNFGVTGDLVVESSIAAFPAGIVADSCLGSVTGVLDYFYDYLLLPRTTADVVTGGTACPPKEATAAACTDGIDNDGNGWNDCGDNNCITAEASCRTVTTISALQTATTPPTGGIELQNVYVAAMSKNKKNIWVQTSTTASANNGMYIYGTGADLDTFVKGSRVNVIGTVVEFNDSTGTDTLTEVKALSVTAGTAGTSTITPVSGQNVTSMSAESYESVLVTLSNVKITTVGASGTFGVGAAAQYPGAVMFKTDDDIATTPIGPANTCYASVTGVWTYLVYENAWGLLPLTATGTGTGSCL